MTVVRDIGPGLCVRCGRRPRQRATFLCDPCRDDPKTAREVARAERLAASIGGDPRRVVIERFAWAGGWGRLH